MPLQQSKHSAIPGNEVEGNNDLGTIYYDIAESAPERSGVVKSSEISAY